MTLQTPPAVSAGGTPPAAPPSPSRGSWLASWRVALRLARRDVRRHRGRSLAVLLMVGVPTMLICTALTIGATAMLTPAESVPLSMGPAQASVTLGDPAGQQVVQSSDPQMGGSMTDGAAAREIPGLRPGGTVEDNASAIGDLLGGEALPWAEGTTRVRVDDRDIELNALAVASPDRLPGKITLTSGRWPRGEGEVLVSAPAGHRGVPTDGSLRIVDADRERTVKVVGTARATNEWATTHDLVLATPSALDEQRSSSGWYVLRPTAVPWSEVTRLNEHGLLVRSAQVLVDPPPLTEIDPRVASEPGSSGDMAQIVVLGATLLLIVIALLVGPAFAVGATRQRRTLALAASNGATAAQLRRTVLAQAIVLGGLSALVGALIAIPVAWVTARVLVDRGAAGLGPFEVPWWQLGAICAIAVVAAVLAALVPAQRLTRLDIVGAMRGKVVVPPPSRWLFVLGLVLTAVGGAGVIVGLDRSQVFSALSAIVLVLGALLLVPRIVHALGHLAGPLPLPLRLALRDLARHRTRSAPTIAAVLAGSAALTIGLIGATSDNTQEQRDYVPQTTPGEAIAYPFSVADGSQGEAGDLIDSVRTALPDIVAVPVSVAGTLEPVPHEGGGYEEQIALAVPTGCTPEAALRLYSGPGGDDACDRSATADSGGIVRQPTLIPSAEIIRRFGLTGNEARTVEAGGAVLVSDSPRTLVSNGRVQLIQGQTVTDPDSGEMSLVGTPRTATVPVVVRASTVEHFAASASGGLLLPTEQAQELGWTTHLDHYLLHDRTGAIDTITEQRLQQLLGADVSLQVERGWVNPLAMVLAVYIAIFTLVLVVVTLTASALSLAEQERDQATIAAVGGSRRTRRVMVGAQTWLLAVIGVLLGGLVGAFPGISIARALTSEGWNPMTGEQLERAAVIDVPWLMLGAILLAVPLLAGLLASLMVRRAPVLTRRTE